MEEKGVKAHSSAIERREKWFKKRAKEEKMIARAEEKIDAYFSEEESGRAYAMFLDMITDSYPFTETIENMIDPIREKYGFDWVENSILVDIIEELANEFPDEFTSEDDKDGSEE